MKTTISIPDSVFKAAEKFAQRVGISRSQLFTDAVRKYLKDHENESVTKKLNKVYSKESSSLDPVAHHLQYLSIRSVLSL